MVPATETKDLSQAQSVTLHPDGAVFDYRMTLGPGAHRIRIPRLGNWQVQGAYSWNVMSQVRLIEALEVPTDVLRPFQERRDALWVRAVTLRNRQLAEQDIANQWTEATLGRADLTEGFVSNWQALFERSGKMFHVLETQNKAFLDAYQALVEECNAALNPIITDHFGENYFLFERDNSAFVNVILDMDENVAEFARRQRLGRSGFEAKWAKRFKPSSLAEHWLQVTIADEGELALTRTVDGAISWKVGQRLFVNDDLATLRREAIITGARELPLNVPLILDESYLSGNLYVPASVNRSISIAAHELPAQRLVTYTPDRIRWFEFGDTRPGTKQYHIGTMDMPSGSQKRVLLAGDDLRLETVSDEWVIIPKQNKVARRMLRLRTPETLFGSPVHVIENDLPVGVIALPDVAANGIFALFLQSDNRIFMTSHTPWQADPQRSSLRQRSGNSTRIINLSEQALSVNLLLTQPVAEHELVEVIHSDLSTAGGENTQPGLWRYRVDLAPASEQTIEHGWIIQTKDEVLLRQ